MRWQRNRLSLGIPEGNATRHMAEAAAQDDTIEGVFAALKAEFEAVGERGDPTARLERFHELTEAYGAVTGGQAQHRRRDRRRSPLT